MNEVIKSNINNFAKWLYKKTRQPAPIDWGELFRGHKILKSKFMPSNTIIFGSEDYKKISDWFLDREITLLTKQL